METGRLDAPEVQTMFDRIAPVYDLMNRVMTVGLDQHWRRETVKAAVRPGDRVLDACCGTGDLAVAALKVGAREVVGLDFSPKMLERARAKQPSVSWLEGDVMDMQFEDGAFGSATVGFGVRNVVDLAKALAELRRVLHPGGRLGILEITTPTGVLAPFYRLWFDRIVPLLGKLVKGGSAYTYLPASVRRFPVPDDLAAMLRDAGFEDVRYLSLIHI